MQKILLSALVILPFVVFSQQKSPFLGSIDPRLYDAYEHKYVDIVAKDDSLLLQRWNFYLDNAFFISDSPLSKTDNEEEHYPSVKIADLQNINILKLEQEQNLKRDYYTESIYKIADTKKYLIYYSGRNFIEKLNKHLSEQQIAKN